MPDGPSRLERLLNLLALLLDTQRPLTRDQIVAQIPGYPVEKTANRRAFERDKETLRGLGVPISVEPVDGNETGYRVRPDEYYLPDLDLTPDETAALHVAVSAVSLGVGEGRGALLKLGGFGEEAASPIASLPIAPALADLFDASRRRAVVTFTYRGERRAVEPWVLSSRRGRWYVVGHDHGRGAIRSFRADRVEGDVAIGEPGAYEVPGDFRPEAHLGEHPWLFGDEAPLTARVLVDPEAVAGFEVALGTADATWERRADGSAVVEVPVVDRAAFRSFVLGFLEHAEVLEPLELRDDIVAWLERIVSPPPR
jgi:proteasome accessory factor B